MKQCANCGNAADDDARYCDVCGQSSFEAEPEPAEDVARDVAPAETAALTEPVAVDAEPVVEVGVAAAPPSSPPEPPAPPPPPEPRITVEIVRPPGPPRVVADEPPAPPPAIETDQASAVLPAPVEAQPPGPVVEAPVAEATPEPLMTAPAAPTAPTEAPPPAPAAEPAVDVRPRLALRPAEEAPAEELEKEVTPADIAQVREDGWFTIGLIGFPTAGKTWFLNRVKERYSSGLAAYTVSPAKVAQLDEVRGSTVITLHRFVLPQHIARRRENKGLHSFVVLDIPGEAMDRAVNRLASRYDIELGSDIVLEAFNVCDALIIMMPVDELLFSHLLADRTKMARLRANGAGQLVEIDGERRELAAELDKLDAKARLGRPLAKADAARREVLAADLAVLDAEWREWMTAQSALNVDKFCDNLGKFANVIHLLQTSNALDIAQVRISEIIRGVAKQTEATTTPVLFALSKMDSLASLSADYVARLEAAGIEADALGRVGDAPAKAVRELAPGVDKHLTQHFKWIKFECVTAFDGQPQGDLKIDYERAHYGVDAIIEWINRIDDFTSGTPRTVRDVDWARRVGPD